MIKYSNKKAINSKKLLDLYKSAGWASKKDVKDEGKLLTKVYKNSQIVVSAWEGKKLVGIIRALTDKKMSGVIFGVLVKKNFRGKGIGTKLVKKCIKKYPRITWHLASDKKTSKFYKKLKFKVDKDLWFIEK